MLYPSYYTTIRNLNHTESIGNSTYAIVDNNGAAYNTSMQDIVNYIIGTPEFRTTVSGIIEEIYENVLKDKISETIDEKLNEENGED